MEAMKSGIPRTVDQRNKEDAMSETSQLELYYMPTCPYCRKVLSFMRANDINLPLHDITTDASAERQLVDVGGKRQVPCLFIKGEALYESDDIIEYLGEHVCGAQDASET
jgi:glutaredoxin